MSFFKRLIGGDSEPNEELNSEPNAELNSEPKKAPEAEIKIEAEAEASAPSAEIKVSEAPRVTKPAAKNKPTEPPSDEIEEIEVMLSGGTAEARKQLESVAAAEKQASERELDSHAEVELPSMEQIATERKSLKHKKEYRRAMTSTVYVLVVVAAIAVLLATLFFPVLQVSGDSMTPTLDDGDILILLKSGSFERGDLVGFYHSNKLLLKRIIGLPGDYVEVDNKGNVYVNDILIDEPYVTDKSLGECDIAFPYQVPENRFFVLGDHRETSIDSRSTIVGCIEKDQIVGKVFLRIWPLGDIKVMG